MKTAFVLISLTWALSAVQAAPSQSAASLGLAQGNAEQPGLARTVALNSSAQPAPVAVDTLSSALPQDSAAEADGPRTTAETTLALLAAGVIALLAVARRRTGR